MSDGYAPSWDFNLAFTVIFGISGLVFYHESFVWPKWRAFSIACALGSLIEAGGYVGRLLLHNDPFSDIGFKLNVVLLTIGPAFFSAGIYLTLKHAVQVFGQRFSRLPPAWYAYVFVACDVISIILQGAGGAISAIASQKTLLNQGVDIMIAGLAFQVFTLLVFIGLVIDFTWRCWRNSHALNPGSTALARTPRFQLFACAVSIAFLCIFARCCYRVAELSGGWGNEIMRKESEFIILDSDMCTLAALALNIFHPGWLLLETGQKELREKDGPVELQRKRTVTEVDLVLAHETWRRRQASLQGKSTVDIRCQQCGYWGGEWI